MKRTLIIASSALLVALSINTASARCVGAVVNGNCLGAEVPGSDSSDYQGSSGSTYQYDLSNPTDRNNYSIDLDAQRRDQMSLDPGKILDTGLGQYGGGIYN
ncbi:MAG: hypothetical protein WAT29_10515 [Thiolinea sp.]